MKLIFILSGENLDLAKHEVLALASSNDYSLDGNILLVDCKKFDFSRLAYCHKVLRFVCKGVKQMETVDWQKYCKGSFCVRFKGNSSMEKELAAFVWKSLKNPKVDLKQPDTKIELFSGERVYCGTTLFENKKDFFSRATKNKPGFHPSSMNPRLAKACVNLSGVKKGEVLLDPFCGAAGIIVEAGLMKVKVVGNDIDNEMLRLAKKNIKHYKVKAKLTEKDALKLKMKADAIVTDLPYGKSSSLHKEKAVKLYNNFLKKAKQLLKKKKRLVMVIPSDIKVKHSFKTVAKIDHYVHHALTRRIYVLEN